TWPALNEPWPFFLGLALFDSVNMGWNSRNGSSALPELSGGSYGRIMEQTTQVNYGYIFPWPDSENLAFSVTAGRQARTFFLSDTAVERKDQKKVVFKKASLQVGLRWSPHPWVLLALDDEVVSSGISRESDVTDAAVQQAVDAFDAFQERSLYFSVSVKY
ncbi:MAG: hypothetical protein OEZ59_11935, partial [Deltaproteobacteria bacterium]|nr:hypothetical protein [Deltaproteobacteria bacterium]